ncbi:MAG TPA: AMP-binding protein [Dehalococcoidia bacterium]|nr:AMP-binding protein [Dehalococcoidia bacterium]
METLVELLADSARRFAPATAVSIMSGVREDRWSYRRLDEFSSRVSRLLQDRGLAKGHRVVLWAPNCPQWVAAWFGCLRAGVVAVPLDLRSAPDFVARVTSQTQPSLAFLCRQTVQNWPGEGLPVVLLEDLEELVDGLGPGQFPSVTATDIAQLMFTSGTTGDPKGVVLSHHNVVSNVLACSHQVPVGPRSRLLSLLPLSHMLEQTGGLLVPLHNGASVAYPVSRQPKTIFKTMQRQRVTNLVVVPQALQLFMNAIEREVQAKGKVAQWRAMQRLALKLPVRVRRWLFRSVHRRMGGGLAYAMSGGAYLDPALARKWAALGVPVLQGYGATETSPVITTNTFRQQKPGSVGRVLPGQAVQIDQDGEILASGPNVAQGYWRNPQATQAAFDGRWYRTGDLGYLDDDKFLFLKGRKKDMIALSSGQKVYPEDIENLLNQQPGIKDGVVVGLPRGGGFVEVHAALLMEDGADAAEAVHAVNQRLADHQQVRGFTLWPEADFPRTHTLKVKKGLVLEALVRMRDGAVAASPATAAAPATAALSGLQRVVASILGLTASTRPLPAEALTPDKTLGGDLNLDSLARVELLSAVEEELGVYLDESQVSATTTLGELEAMVQAGAAQPEVKFPNWGRSWWCRLLRPVLQSAVVFPFLRLFYGMKVTGLENLKGLTGPALFAANHNVKLDNGFVLMALPFAWRRRLCPAAARETVFVHPFWKIAVPLLGNGFPFSREGAVRPSMERLGWLMDQGHSVLIYPEGRQSYGGPMAAFKPGAGMVAVESRTPVVPVRVVLNKPSVWDGGSLLSRGRVEVRFGPAINFPRKTDYRDATAQLEAAVRSL